MKLEAVQLRFPPEVVPPLLVGGRGPKTLSLAGELADGIILDEAATGGLADPARVRESVGIVAAARVNAGRPGEPEVVAFLPTAGAATAAYLADQILRLGAAGVHRVASFAGGVDGPPASGEPVLRFVEVLAQAQEIVHRG